MLSSDTLARYKGSTEILAQYFNGERFWPVGSAPDISAVSITPASGLHSDTYTASYTGDPGAPAGSVSYQWFRNGVAISGATAASYAGTLDDLGLISCEIAINNATGSDVLESAGARVTLDPAALLAGASSAMWLDPSDLSGFYVDDGVTNAVSGQTVQRWNDKSGVGSISASQATSADRPTLVTEADGRIGLQFDGGDQMALSSDLTAGGIVIGTTASAGDTSNNRPTPLGSASGQYITVGTGSYRYRSSTDSSTSPVASAKTTAQVASFNTLSPNSTTLGDMNAYQDGIPASDNPEDKELIDNIDLLGRRSSGTYFDGTCYQVIMRATPFSDQERLALQEYVATKTWPVAAGEELHSGDGIPFTTYVYQGV